MLSLPGKYNTEGNKADFAIYVTRKPDWHNHREDMSIGSQTTSSKNFIAFRLYTVIKANKFKKGLKNFPNKIAQYKTANIKSNHFYKQI